jgi:hypothetical protein
MVVSILKLAFVRGSVQQGDFANTVRFHVTVLTFIDRAIVARAFLPHFFVYNVEDVFFSNGSDI